MAEAVNLAQYIDHDFVVFPPAVDSTLIDEYLALFERMWDDAPDTVWARSGGALLHPWRDLYDKNEPAPHDGRPGAIRPGPGSYGPSPGR